MTGGFFDPDELEEYVVCVDCGERLPHRPKTKEQLCTVCRRKRGYPDDGEESDDE